MADSTPPTSDITMSTIATLVKDLLIAASNTSTLAWLDRLPTEVRLEIFKLAQQHQGALLVVDQLNKDAIVDVSLLVALVNDKKSVEAVEGFFTANTFRLTKYAELLSPKLGLADRTGDAYKYITHLELRNVARSEEFMSVDGLELVVKECGDMPRLKEVTVAYDSLGGNPNIELSYRETLRESLAGMGYSELTGWKLECVGVGKYTMSRSSSPTITFVHVALMERWACMKMSPPATLESQAQAFHEATQDPRVDEMLSHFSFIVNMSLAEWVVVWERCCILTDSGAYTSLDLTLPSDQLKLFGVFLEYAQSCPGDAEVRKHVITGNVLRELDEESVGNNINASTSVKSAEVMEGLSELLRKNSGASPRIAGGGEKYRREQARNLGRAVPVYKDDEGNDEEEDDVGYGNFGAPGFGEEQ
ncbi:hypothetical protein LTR56_004952 [Elasticomyces elasticus]|nr:hypothetical protein LTR56_004952 [Elasticomyces elasticus]